MPNRASASTNETGHTVGVEPLRRMVPSPHGEFRVTPEIVQGLDPIIPLTATASTEFRSTAHPQNRAASGYVGFLYFAHELDAESAGTSRPVVRKNLICGPLK